MNIETIWPQYRAALRNFLHSRINSHADAEDVLQEILIKSYDNLDYLKQHKSVKAWLFQIANHSLIDFYRRQGRTRANLGELIQQSNPEHRDNHQDSELDLANCIAPFINALPAEQAALLTAVDIESRSQKSLAQEMGISYSTLKSRVQKSRQQLKGLFDACCHFERDARGKVYDYEKRPTPCRDC